MSGFFARITAPIPGESPFGADVNHDTGYERLKGEMGKLGDIDINAVEALSFEILTERSKDVRAMAFLAYSMLRKGDIEGLADVFCALADYCADSFESIFPQREGAKLAALRWFSDQRFSSQCPKTDVSSALDKPHVTRLKEALEKLKPALEKRFASTGAPFPHVFYRRVTEWERAVGNAPEPPAKDGGNDAGAAMAVNNGNRSGADKNDRDVSVDGGRESVVISLTREEYRELIRCVNAMEALLKKVLPIMHY